MILYFKSFSACSAYAEDHKEHALKIIKGMLIMRIKNEANAEHALKILEAHSACAKNH